jgi:hypothetical protein
VDGNQINQIIRKTQRAWFEDGIWEIGFGVSILLISLYYWGVIWLDLAQRLGMWLPLLQIVFFFAAFLPVRWVVTTLKERVAFPRSGYVAFRREPVRRRWQRFATGGLIGAFVSILAVVFSLQGTLESRIPIVVGLALAGAMTYISIRYAILRFTLTGLLSFAAAVGIAVLRLETTMGMAALMSAFGILTLGAGGIALWRFMCSTPVAQESEEA